MCTVYICVCMMICVWYCMCVCNLCMYECMVCTYSMYMHKCVVCVHIRCVCMLTVSMGSYSMYVQHKIEGQLLKRRTVTTMLNDIMIGI